MKMIRTENITKKYKRYKKQEGVIGSIKGLFHREYEEKIAVERCRCDIGQSTGAECHGIGYGHCYQQHGTGATADIGNSRGYKSDNEERYDKSEKFAEKSVECGKAACCPCRENESGADAKRYRNGDAWQQSDFKSTGHRFFR